MDRVAFTDIPQEYKLMINDIQNKGIKKIYSTMNFLYLQNPYFNEIQEENFNNCKNQNNIEIYITDYIKKFKFITFQLQFRNINININKPGHDFDKIKNYSEESIDVVFCCENQCAIIEKMEFKIIERIIQEIKNQKISIINASETNYSLDLSNDKNEEINIKEEIGNFYEHYKNEMIQNRFFQLTFRAISGYLIRRYFYPTNHFNNPSFFKFNLEDTNEQNVVSLIDSILYENNKQNMKLTNIDISNIINEAKKIKNDNKIKIQYFFEEDFIVLRKVYSNDIAVFNLVFHLPSFHIFLMKKLLFPEKSIKEYEHEIYFCEHFCNRTFVPFYGFVKKNNKVVSLIYEFMSNGSLIDFITSNINEHQNTEILILIRIFQGINYLHSNSLIHRDLKPLNILFDHDNLPYISDFETIRLINENLDQKTITNDIGSLLYTSPEQDIGKHVSFYTDIYSFGLIIFFIFEKEDMWKLNRFSISSKQDNLISSMKNGPKNIQDLFKQCVNSEISMRPNHKRIKSILLNEFNIFTNSILNIDKIKFDMNRNDLIQYVFENIIIVDKNDYIERSVVFENIFSIQILILHKDLKNKSDFLFKLGNYYESSSNCDYIKASKYYELSSQLNNSFALNNLGDLYRKGYGVEKNYIKSKYFFEKSSKLNNSYALNNLGLLYLNGHGVIKDYSKAIKYFELSAKQNNPCAFCNLGNSYYHGVGVKQDYKMAKKYYKISAKLNNSVALCNIARLYRHGNGVKKNYAKAKKYYELAAQFNNMNAINSIGNMYYYGDGIDRNYEITKKYYELAAKYNTLAAINNLGDYYYHGFAVAKDYLKAKEFYELAAKLNSSYANLHLGDIYFNGYGIKQDYSKAIEYYELSSQSNNTLAIVKLGNLYKKGLGVEQNYSLARQYYEIAAELNNSDALIKLAKIYYYGQGVQQNYMKAKKYYELAAEKNNFFAYFHLGNSYSNDDAFKNDIYKSIEFFSKCIEKNNERVNDYNFIDNCSKNIYRYNKYYYRSCNDLGLIYLIFFSDMSNTIKYLKDAAFAEYPFGQNNYGLLCQFYLDKYQDAKHYYLRSSEHNFALANYNIGHLYEKEGNIEEAIKHYLKANENENEPLIFHNHLQHDDQLEISKVFIICFINLKLTNYYLSQNKYQESKLCFVKSFSKFKFNENLSFSIKFLNFDEIISEDNLSSFLLFKELFIKLFNHFEIKLYDNNYAIKPKQLIISGNLCFKDQLNTNNIDSVFRKIDKFFDYFISFDEKLLMKEINHFIKSIEKIIYKPPYQILFGRLKGFMHDSNIKTDSLKKDINEQFKMVSIIKISCKLFFILI